MQTFNIQIELQELSYDELSASDAKLVDYAKSMTLQSYAPHSGFHVGAALQMADGSIYGGANQENASFPVGTCAERAAFFFASADKPETAPETIAIAAETQGDFTASPVTPCGMCRQALLEAETRHRRPLRVILYGTAKTYIIPSVSQLLPLSFDGNQLKD